MFVCIGGIPGIGKTTVIKKILELNTKLPIQSMNERKILQQLAGVQSVKDYRKLPDTTRSNLRKKMYQQFYATDRNDKSTIRLLDIHFAWPQNDGTYLNRPIRAKKQILAIIVLVADPYIIFQRRLRDLTRINHNIEKPETIKKHQSMEIKNAISQANILGIPFIMIKNSNGELSQTASAILSFIEEFIN